jgi:branched-chain amino acid transport system substrate-binding protein
MKRLLYFLPVLVIVIVFTLLVVYRKSQTTPENTLTVGVILPQTGILAAMGQYERQAMELAAEDLVPSGCKIRFLFEDGKGDNKVVAMAADKLLDIDRADVLITSTSSASEIAAPVAQRKNKLLLAFCMGSDIAPKFPDVVRFYVGIDEETHAILDYLKNLPSNTRLALLYSDAPVYKAAVQELYEPFFKQHFTNPVTIEEYELKTKDFAGQLTKIMVQDSNVLVLLGQGFEYELLFKRMIELRLREHLQIVGGWGFLYTTLPDQQVEGIHVAGPTYVFMKYKDGGDFEERFIKRYGHPPNFDAAFAYELIRKLPEIFEIYKSSSPDQFKRSLAKKGVLKGVMGNYSFNTEGNLIVETGMGVIHAGQITAGQ